MSEEENKKRRKVDASTIRKIVASAFELGHKLPLEMKEKSCSRLFEETFSIPDLEEISVNNPNGFRNYSSMELAQSREGTFYEHEEKGIGVVEKGPDGKKVMVWSDDSVSQFNSDTETPWDKMMRLIPQKKR